MKTSPDGHPSARQLAALALGKPAGAGDAWVSAHVNDCPTCAAFLAETPHKSLLALVDGVSAAKQLAPSKSAPQPSAVAAERFAQSMPPTEPPRAQSAKPNGSGKPAGAAPIPAALLAQTKYQIRKLLGQGGMGSVYLAYHERMDREVAIKVVNAALVDQPDALQRFDQEVKAAAKLDHVNVARAYDADEFGTLRVLVMEYVRGQSLDVFLAKRGRLSVVEACRVVRQAAAGLDHAHQRGMVHRDLKPQNLMLTPEGRVKILDFGLAKIASEHLSEQGLTRDNTLMGTPHFLAPEQARDAAKADIRADLYSLGCTLYCLLTGKPPFHGLPQVQILLAHQNETPRSLCDVRTEIPLGLSQLVDKLLAKNPADRLQSPRELADALLPFARGTHTPDQEQTADPFAFLESVPERSASSPPLRSAATRSESRARQVGYATAGAAALLALVGMVWAWGLPSVPVETVVAEAPPVENVTPTAPMPQAPPAEGATLDAPKVESVVPEARPPAAVARAVETESAVAPSEVPVEDGTRAAEAPEGTWSVEGDEIVQSSLAEGRSILVFGDPSWSRYNFEASGMIVEGTQGFSLVFNAESCWNFRFFGVGGYDGTWDELATVDRVQSAEGVRQMHRRPIEKNRWYRLRVEVRGAECRCLVDGQQVLTNVDPHFAAGRVGISGWGTSYRIKDVLVTDEQGQELWKGPPGIVGRRTGPAGLHRPLITGEWTQERYPEADGLSGDWKSVDDELRQTSLATQNSTLVFGDPSWRDYNLNLRAKADVGPNAFAVGWNVQDANNFRVLRIGWQRNSRHELSRFVAGKEHDIGVLPGTLDRTSWHDVRIEVRGPQARCLLDNQLLFDKEEPLLPVGRVGFGSFDGSCRFKDIVVTSADDKTVLWRGLPKLPGQNESNAPLSRLAKIIQGTGKWRIEGTMLTVDASGPTGEQALLFGDPTWTDYDFSCVVSHRKDARAIALLFRCPDDLHCQYFMLGSDREHREVGFKVREGNRQIAKQGPDFPHLKAPLGAGKKYLLKVEVRGNQVRGFLDGRQVAEYTGSRHERGRLGVATRFGPTTSDVATFSEILVVAPNGSVLWHGPPELPTDAK